MNHVVLEHSFFLLHYIYQNNILYLLRTIFVLLYGIYDIVRLYILPFYFSFLLMSGDTPYLLVISTLVQGMSPPLVIY